MLCFFFLFLFFSLLPWLNILCVWDDIPTIALICPVIISSCSFPNSLYTCYFFTKLYNSMTLYFCHTFNFLAGDWIKVSYRVLYFIFTSARLWHPHGLQVGSRPMFEWHVAQLEECFINYSRNNEPLYGILKKTPRSFVIVRMYLNDTSMVACHCHHLIRERGAQRTHTNPCGCTRVYLLNNFCT